MGDHDVKANFIGAVRDVQAAQTSSEDAARLRREIDRAGVLVLTGQRDLDDEALLRFARHLGELHRSITAQRSDLSYAGGRIYLPSGADNSEHGGETEFADARGAYDALAPAMKSRIDGLIVTHSLARTRQLVGTGGTFTAEEEARFPVRIQPLVRRNARTGERHCISARTRRASRDGARKTIGRCSTNCLILQHSRSSFTATAGRQASW